MRTERKCRAMREQKEQEGKEVIVTASRQLNVARVASETFLLQKQWDGTYNHEGRFEEQILRQVSS